MWEVILYCFIKLTNVHANNDYIIVIKKIILFNILKIGIRHKKKKAKRVRWSKHIKKNVLSYSDLFFLLFIISLYNIYFGSLYTFVILFNVCTIIIKVSNLLIFGLETHEHILFFFFFLRTVCDACVLSKPKWFTKRRVSSAPRRFFKNPIYIF